MTACAPALKAVPLAAWVPAPAADSAASDIIQVGDLVNVQVWKGEQFATRQRVRSDGRITLFFLGDVSVAGRTPTQVGDSLAYGLRELYAAPRVNVMIEEAAASTISILGEVARSGTFPIRRPVAVLEAIAMAGGLTEFAKKDRLIVVRQGTRIRLRFDELMNGVDAARGLRLQPGDVLLVQ